MFSLVLSPPLAKITFLAPTANDLKIAPPELSTLSSFGTSIILSTILRFFTIVARSLKGINALPFLRISHASELIPTHSSSPRFFAASK